MELEICLQFLTVSSILPPVAEVAVAADRNMLEVSPPSAPLLVYHHQIPT